VGKASASTALRSSSCFACAPNGQSELDGLLPESLIAPQPAAGTLSAAANNVDQAKARPDTENRESVACRSLFKAAFPWMGYVVDLASRS
jgi:hypothetical protein